MKSKKINILVIFLLFYFFINAQDRKDATLAKDIISRIELKDSTALPLLKNNKVLFDTYQYSYLLAYYKFKKSKYEDSKVLFLKTIGHKELDYTIYGKAFYYLGRNYSYLEKYDSALFYYDKQIELEQKKLTASNKAENYFQKAYCYKKIDKRDSTLIFYEKASLLFLEENDSSGIAKTYINLGSFYRSFNKTASIKHYIKALKIYRNLKNGMNNHYAQLIKGKIEINTPNSWNRPLNHFICISNKEHLSLCSARHRPLEMDSILHLT